MKKVIYTKNAPAPVGPYSQAIQVGNVLYCSGQIGLNPCGNIMEEGIENQTLQVIKNILEILTEAGFEFEDVVKTTCFLDDMKNFSVFNDIYSKYFTSNPARSCVEAKLPKEAMVEVEVVAVK